MTSRRQSSLLRSLQLAAGLVLMVFGPIIGLPTPGPLGFVLFGIGLALVLRSSRWAKKRYVRSTRRYPKLKRAMDTGLRRRRRLKVPIDTDGETALGGGELTGGTPAPTSPRV